VALAQTGDLCRAPFPALTHFEGSGRSDHVASYPVTIFDRVPAPQREFAPDAPSSGLVPIDDHRRGEPGIARETLTHFG
jgi:hypothetical protein